MDVAVAGAAMTQFGERDEDLLGLLAEAGRACLADAGVAPHASDDDDEASLAPDVVDALVVATASGDYEHRQGTAGALASELGLTPARATAVDQTSAGGAAALRTAWQSVAAGASDCVLVVGGERMTHLDTPALTDRIAGIAHPVEYAHGVTLPAFAGLTARRYLDRFDAPREALAEVAVKNHEHGLDNPKAHFRRSVDVETVLSSPVIADPLRLYDFCPVSDGSAALLVTTTERAREWGLAHAEVAGVGAASDTHVVHERAEPTRLRAAERAGEAAFERANAGEGSTGTSAGQASEGANACQASGGMNAGVDRSSAGEDGPSDRLGPADVDVAELHDMFTILEPLQMEALGLAERGRAWERVAAGETHRSGPLPINTSGGLKSKGHPLSASGVAQVVECYEQLTGQAGPRQVPADVALTCNVGGFGNCVIVTLLERPDR